MKLKRWLLLFFGVCLLCAALFALMNYLVDPFGVFGDNWMDWYSYDMTQNPRVAKVTWLEEHHGDYDSYVIGSSKASSLPVAELNDYLDASFYNMTWYGGKLWDEERMLNYLLDHYTVKNIVLTVEPQIALHPREDSDDLKQQMHCAVDGSDPLRFYASYLFCNPDYAISKLQARAEDGFLQNANTVYLPETGEYDKQVRDATPIGTVEDYLAAEAGPFESGVTGTALPYVDESLKTIAQMKARCDAAGVNLLVVCLPLSVAEQEYYDAEDVARLLTGLAEITDYWSFMGRGTVQSDVRYYYDSDHFRNDVGSMMLARIFEREEVYIPEDFGVYVTAENAAATVAAIETETGENVSKKVPILMYHSFVETEAEVTSGETMTVAQFEAQLKALTEAGWQAVHLSELEDFVRRGTELPEKAFVITMDDGYANNLTLAAPILEKYGACAAVAIIGCSAGKDSYKDTGVAMTPHFDLTEAETWQAAGVIDLISHTYDMHQVATLDGEGCRAGAAALEGETEADYVAFLREDLCRSREQLSGTTALAWPYGASTQISEIVAHDCGFSITLSTEPGASELTRGIAQSLYLLRRNNITQDITPEALVKMLEGFTE